MEPYSLADGTPAYHRPGELPTDVVEDKVLCGLCGTWYRALGAHLRYSHTWTAQDYRQAFGLRAGRPLQAPGVSQAQSKALTHRIGTDPRVQAGMRAGVALARSGQLRELGLQAVAEGRVRLERQRMASEHGRRLGNRRADRFRAERDRAARDLGYADADELLEACCAAGTSVADLALALRCAQSTVIREMDRLSIPRRPQSHRLALGRQALAARHAATATSRRARVQALGFVDTEAYLRARHHGQRWPRRMIADELGVTVPVIERLLKVAGIKGLRGLNAGRAQH